MLYIKAIINAKKKNDTIHPHVESRVRAPNKKE
jgi:hypothetical protein